MSNHSTESAFPGMEYDVTAGQRYHYGLSLRDYFAAKMLHGLNNHQGMNPVTFEKCAKQCYGMADAMLKAREE